MEDLSRIRLDPEEPRPPFSCGDPDLDEFYGVDSIDGGRQLLSVTYAFQQGAEVVAFVSLSNDSIKRDDLSRSSLRRLFKRVPHEKRYSSMPAAKIGRLGVASALHRTGLGTRILDYLKVWFTEGNKTGCRFLTVDAYNNAGITSFYESNGFVFLSEDDHADSTRIMFFDLITFRD